MSNVLLKRLLRYISGEAIDYTSMSNVIGHVDVPCVVCDISYLHPISVVNVNIDVQHALVRLQQFQDGQYAVVHIAKPGRLALCHEDEDKCMRHVNRVSIVISSSQNKVQGTRYNYASLSGTPKMTIVHTVHSAESGHTCPGRNVTGQSMPMGCSGRKAPKSGNNSFPLTNRLERSGARLLCCSQHSYVITSPGRNGSDAFLSIRSHRTIPLLLYPQRGPATLYTRLTN